MFHQILANDWLTEVYPRLADVEPKFSQLLHISDGKGKEQKCMQVDPVVFVTLE